MQRSRAPGHGLPGRVPAEVSPLDPIRVAYSETMTESPDHTDVPAVGC